MSWTWQATDDAGAEVAGIDIPKFDSQADAESWIGECWHDLLDDGATAVTLLEGDRIEYAGMSLNPPA